MENTLHSFLWLEFEPHPHPALSRCYGHGGRGGSWWPAAWKPGRIPAGLAAAVGSGRLRENAVGPFSEEPGCACQSDRKGGGLPPYRLQVGTQFLGHLTPAPPPPREFVFAALGQPHRAQQASPTEAPSLSLPRLERLRIPGVAWPSAPGGVHQHERRSADRGAGWGGPGGQVPCCVRAPTPNQRLLSSVKWFSTTSESGLQGCGRCHS